MTDTIFQRFSMIAIMACTVWLVCLLIPMDITGREDPVVVPTWVPAREPRQTTNVTQKPVLNERPMSTLERGVLEVIETLKEHGNVTAWPVGGTLIHLLRHGRFSDYEEHDQEYDIDLAVGVEDDTVQFSAESRQWLIDIFVAKNVLRPHKLTGKRSQAGTGTCRNRKDTFIQCKHLHLPLKFDIFLSKPEDRDDQVFYAPIGTQPKALLHPMQTCKAWNTSIACPAEPYALLKIWGVHTGYEVKEGCLLFPRHLQKQIAVFETLSDVQKMSLQNETMTLIGKAEVLQSQGHASFKKVIARDEECRAAIGKIMSWESRPSVRNESGGSLEVGGEKK
eukprot:TRINITY_DN5398_c0_g1_i1.p1 TRINITY_DN5398_c0_g1~~TRINITY_DN5398_c0_g1_i1.p1  ORF type:complete len:336 (+),score=27.27 TRINITY_DN5398_c0_g1_i1:62-1069(+)